MLFIKKTVRNLCYLKKNMIKKYYDFVIRHFNKYEGRIRITTTYSISMRIKHTHIHKEVFVFFSFFQIVLL